jgi:hypothetical protein
VAYGCDEVVRCSWNGGHTWPSYNGDLVWEFLSQFDNADHVGFGRTTGDTNLTATTHGLTEVQNLPAHTVIDTSDFRHFQGIKKSPDAKSPSKTHYGNPKHGCMSDEEVLLLAGGSVCAPVVKMQDAPNTQKAQCTFMDATPNARNGCPQDTPATTRGTFGAFPSCSDFNTAENQHANAHCTLTCGPCREGESDEECMEKANDSCPHGAVCKVGYHRHMELGTCVYQR